MEPLEPVGANNIYSSRVDAVALIENKVRGNHPLNNTPKVEGEKTK